MSWRVMVGIVAIVLFAALAGCGGGGTEGGAGGGDVGSAAGSVSPDTGSPADFRLLLDGQEIAGGIKADGHFELPGIPPGDHVLDVVGPDGMAGGRANFSISPDQQVQLPPIRPRPAGQIVGLVMKLSDDGSWAPAPRVHVIARSDLVWILTDDELRLVDQAGGGAQLAQDADPGAAMPLIYPPPPGETYEAVTDAAGSYAMKGVPPGGYLVTVAAPGYVSRPVYVNVKAGRTSVADFRLKPDVAPQYGAVAGQVVGVGDVGVPPPGPTDAAKKPIAGAVVEIILDEPWTAPPSSEPPEVQPDVTLPIRSSQGASGTPVGGGSDPTIVMPPIRWRRFATRTDKNGMYELKAPAGRRTVAAWAWGYMPKRQTVDIAADTTVRVNFELQALIPVPAPGPGPGPLEPPPDPPAPAN